MKIQIRSALHVNVTKKTLKIWENDKQKSAKFSICSFQNVSEESKDFPCGDIKEEKGIQVEQREREKGREREKKREREGEKELKKRERERERKKGNREMKACMVSNTNKESTVF